MKVVSVAEIDQTLPQYRGRSQVSSSTLGQGRILEGTSGCCINSKIMIGFATWDFVPPFVPLSKVLVAGSQPTADTATCVYSQET